MSTIRGLDVSGCFFPIWRVKEAAGKPIGDAATEAVQALRERAAAAGADYVVACCDSGRCFRHDIALEYRQTDPDYRGYKGNRPERDAALIAALDRVIDNLEQDGVPVFRAPGFEADDILATLATWATAQGHDVEIVSDDKDLRALVCAPMTLTVDGEPVQHGGVSVVKRDGEVIGPAEVKTRFGVEPHQMAEYLAMVGDTSDHIKGIPGIGETKAAAMLSTYGTFAAIYEAAERDQEYVSECECKLALAREEKVRPLPTFAKPKFQNATRAAILASRALFDISLRLTRLRTDVPVDFAQVTAPRVPKPRDMGFDVDMSENDNASENEEEDDIMTTSELQPLPPMGQSTTTEAPPSSGAVSAEIVSPTTFAEQPAPPQGMLQPAAAMTVHVAPPPRADLAVRDIQQATEQAITRAPGAYSLSLDPRDFKEARVLAKDVFDARIFPKIKSPQQALALIMAGREYGLPAMASLRLIHEIEGQMAIHAQVKIGLAMKSPRVEYMEVVDWHDNGDKSYCVWRGKRRNRQKEDVCKYGVEHARAQGLVKPNSNWIKMPGWMSMVRSGANLSTILIPDEMAGLYTFDEMGAAEVVLYGADGQRGEAA